MPVDDLRVLLFSLAFGALMGWGLGWRADDRLPALVTASATAGIGVIVWIAALVREAPPDGLLATAAVSLGAGGLAALTTIAVTGRR